MREMIEKIVSVGGSICFPYNTKMNDWMGEAKITGIGLPFDTITYIVQWPYGLKKYKDLSKALDFFMKTVFLKRNMALAFEGARRHNLSNKDYDDLSEKEIKALVKEYNDKFFALDYPFKGKKG